MIAGGGPTREDLEARWQILWATGVELTERHGRLLASMPTVEDAIGKRAFDQLHAEQEQHKRDLAELKADMVRHGGFS